MSNWAPGQSGRIMSLGWLEGPLMCFGLEINWILTCQCLLSCLSVLSCFISCVCWQVLRKNTAVLFGLLSEKFVICAHMHHLYQFCWCTCLWFYKTTSAKHLGILYRRPGYSFKCYLLLHVCTFLAKAQSNKTAPLPKSPRRTPLISPAEIIRRLWKCCNKNILSSLFKRRTQEQQFQLRWECEQQHKLILSIYLRTLTNLMKLSW